MFELFNFLNYTILLFFRLHDSQFFNSSIYKLFTPFWVIKSFRFLNFWISQFFHFYFRYFYASFHFYKFSFSISSFFHMFNYPLFHFDSFIHFLCFNFPKLSIFSFFYFFCFPFSVISFPIEPISTFWHYHQQQSFMINYFRQNIIPRLFPTKCSSSDNKFSNY